MHQTSDELDKSLKDSLLKNANKIELIDNTNSSKALKCLERIGDIKLSHTETCYNETKDDDYVETLVEYIDGILKDIYKEEFTTIKQALLKAQKDKAKIEKLKQENAILNAELDTFKKLAFKGKSE